MMGRHLQHYAAYIDEAEGGLSCLCGLRHREMRPAFECAKRYAARPGPWAPVYVASFDLWPPATRRPGGRGQISHATSGMEDHLLARLPPELSRFWRGPGDELAYCATCNTFGAPEQTTCTACGAALDDGSPK